MSNLQPITYGIPDVANMPIPTYSSSSYKLGEEVANGFKWWGHVKCTDKKYTALFICPECNNVFTAQITKILDGSITSCSCK